jgi:hypothetical protein
MQWLIGLVLFVAMVAALEGPKYRPWVIGISLIGCGFILDMAFVIWVSDWAARYEMGLFAIFEAMLFLARLGCVLASLVLPAPPVVHQWQKATAWAAWVLAGLVAAWMVLNRLASRRAYYSKN